MSLRGSSSSTVFIYCPLGGGVSSGKGQEIVCYIFQTIFNYTKINLYLFLENCDLLLHVFLATTNKEQYKGVVMVGHHENMLCG